MDENVNNQLREDKEIEVLTNAQAQALRAAINSDDVNTMKSFLSSMESSPGTLLHADKSMKAASGAVTAKMAKLHETQSGS